MRHAIAAAAIAVVRGLVLALAQLGLFEVGKRALAKHADEFMFRHTDSLQ